MLIPSFIKLSSIGKQSSNPVFIIQTYSFFHLAMMLKYYSHMTLVIYIFQLSNLFCSDQNSCFETAYVNTYIQEVWLNHAIRSAIAITKLLLWGDILKKKKNNKRNALFYSISLEFFLLAFWFR